MQVPDLEKRKTILRTARDLFSRRPYHEVRLEDVAAAAKVGKGTLYVYFTSKEHLYIELVVEAFDALLADCEQIADDVDAPAWDSLEELVRHVSKWTLKHPTIFDIIRSGVNPAGNDALRARRKKLGHILERVIRCGVERGEMDDASPELTANFIPAMARSGAVFGRSSLKAEELATKILAVLAGGIRRNA
jgi:AcrR family transcriptional regulator